jgi:hypothetical protein
MVVYYHFVICVGYEDSTTAKHISWVIILAFAFFDIVNDYFQIIRRQWVPSIVSMMAKRYEHAFSTREFVMVLSIPNVYYHKGCGHDYDNDDKNDYGYDDEC